MSKSNVFVDAMNDFRREGTLCAKSAKRPLNLIVDATHVRLAKQHDENECVVAKALADCQPTAIAISVGERITKVLYQDGTLLRFTTPGRLREALKGFDKTGKWNLPKGIYRLGVPTYNDKLLAELPPEMREKTRKRWDKFVSKQKGTGSGINYHNSRHLSTRQISIAKAGHSNGGRKKAKA